MAGVPFLYVNIAALCCYVLLFVAFLAAKKTPEIRWFIVLMVCFIFWTGGSILMRMETFPGLNFWFYVSLLALFSIALLVYLFVCSFARVRQPFLATVWIIGTLAVLVLSACGIFLKPPTAEVTAAGKLFHYSMTWHIAIPYLFLMCIIVSVAAIFRQMIRKMGNNMPGMKAIITGCVAISLGNILQIIPGNTFPWDQLSGIVFAVLLVMGLYRRRMFHMTLLVSRSVLLVISTVIAMILLSAFIEPLRNLLLTNFPISENSITAILAVLFAIVILGFYLLTRKLVDVLFSFEEQQHRLISAFSDEVSRTLNTADVMRTLADTIKDNIPVDSVYVCLKEGDEYVARHNSEPLGRHDFRISASNPYVKALQRSEEGYIVTEDFRSSTLYRSMWENERQLFSSMNIGCISAIKDGEDIVGMILLAEKTKNTPYSFTEMDFLATISSISSIAIKNAGLYEQMYREARIDSLTGVFNYRAFVEKSAELYEKYGEECLSLLDLDLDDFKLYNQLYGTIEGDYALRQVADIIKSCVGEHGTVYRLGGKIFSVLLPLWDGHKTQNLAEEIRAQVATINQSAGRSGYKTLTISAGICVSPFAASSVKELIDNADLATYTAKNSGKNNVVIKQGEVSGTKSLRERMEEIVGNSDPTFEANSPIVSALTAAIDAKDHYTCQHSSNVARYATLLALGQGLSDEEIRVIYQAALLHDIGKISIPESILSKQSSLSDTEFRIMQSHVNSSIDMIRHLPAMDYLVPAAVGHHERWDGKGYPRGIAGEEIPITARCLAIADAFDAMTTDRPYRKGLSVEYAIEQVRRNAGTQFDPVLAEKFVELVCMGEIKTN